jgi:hypothetical protein
MIRETAREIAADCGDDYWRAVTGPEKREPSEFWAECAEVSFSGRRFRRSTAARD